MPNIPAFSSPVDFLGVFFLTLGVIILLAGLGILNIEKVSIKPGGKTLCFGVLLSGVGAVFLLPWLKNTLVFTATEIPPTHTSVSISQNNPPISTVTQITQTFTPESILLPTTTPSLTSMPTSTPTIETVISPTFTPSPTIVPTPQPSFIVFVRYPHGWKEMDATRMLYRINSDGTNETPLTDPSYKSRDPSWSPHGEIAFASDRDGDYDIYIMDANGNNWLQLTDDNEKVSDRGPSWSPDGEWIAFHSPHEGNSEIYIGNQERSSTSPPTSEDFLGYF